MGEPIIPDPEKLRRVRRGHKISRFFRHIFEHKNIKKILGSNLALVVLASSVVSGSGIEAEETVQVEQTVISNNEIQLTTERGVAYPVEPPTVNQGYHLVHRGVDFEGVTGQTVNAIMSGVVSQTAYSNYALGNIVQVDHSDNYSSIYAHLSKISVEEGDQVTTFTKLGEVGTTGWASGDHLHLEVHKDGYPVNPFVVLPR